MKRRSAAGGLLLHWRLPTLGAPAKAALLFATVFLASSVVVFLIERNRNPEFGSLFDGIWWTMVTVATVGYGDKIPLTPAGRIVAMFLMLVGVAMMGTITARIASFLLERHMKEEKGLLDHSAMRDHVIVCGWKQEMGLVLDAILHKNPGTDPSRMVMINQADYQEIEIIRSDPAFRAVKYIHGDSIEDRDLVRAGVRNASRVVVLADHAAQGDLQQIDSKTIMSVMSIKNLNRRAYVCAELLDRRFEKYLRLLHCDEVLLSRDFSRYMLASASSGAGLSHVVQALLSDGSGARLSTEALPDACIGKTYAEVAEHFRRESSALLVGILENTGTWMELRKEAIREAQKNPDITRLVPDLKRAKALAANHPVINPPPDYPVKKYSRGIVIAGTTAGAPW